MSLILFLSVHNAPLQDLCRVVMPAAGVSVGLLGLFVIDICLNFEAIRHATSLVLCCIQAPIY